MTQELPFKLYFVVNSRLKDPDIDAMTRMSIFNELRWQVTLQKPSTRVRNTVVNIHILTLQLDSLHYRPSSSLKTPITSKPTATWVNRSLWKCSDFL